ncbi:hypothetical protein [Bradyrhizobium elkanii]|uniref:hypothetical protein n=1 Tax=Bradyrhizobium elkanii TaxID=29448 RepID=UPI0021698788|nr:hypothetical protein [Bradyrhizobium elkanii]MCS3519272.1 hypothetical protein [Bradyrhizobium elkanii]MCS4066929.1 hypothetical protein [Bradyrhizobium elkanii]MCS4082464.1 hypothetical protein [Bradyrhizobium elkanii]MCW2127918.1 hypothetical protein [Bradyrhizobium elkanii]MCW2174661.1 hypothetical protein [Bradyrhizobium elkanii]
MRTLADASLGLRVARQDTHTVTIGPAISDKKSLAQGRQQVFKPVINVTTK